MNIIELAIQEGWEVPGGEGFYFDNNELEAFATAIIENYKAGLVPAVYIDEFGNIELNLKDWMVDEPNVFWIPLYALGETK